MKESIEQIKRIKDKLNNQKLSVLVGAGFSKNVSDRFPTWWGLIYDIAEFLYKTEIADSYNLYLISRKTKTKRISEKEYYTKRIDEIIEREGYLEIVSEYIKRKGFTESITTYIEEKTPHIKNVGGKKFLSYMVSDKEQQVELTPEMLSLHTRLLQLPWNNIYTTNYDTLLEDVVDSSLESELKKKIEEIENELEKLSIEELNSKNRLNCLNKIETTNNFEIENFETFDKTTISKSDYLSKGEKSISIEKLKSRKTKIDQLQNSLKYNLYRISRLKPELESNLRLLNKGLNDCLTIVKHSTELQIKRNKNIIKLHGTLRADNSDKFGFDEDIHRHYIIAKEDYETYPQKHEAFTQLMRISLLQESYVLLGFSGVDPNFTSWIGWVRDILEKKTGNTNNDYKIYLVDVGNTPTNAEKKLFYKNHRIIRIPLMEDDLIDFLQLQSNVEIKNKKDIKEVFELFFTYLSQDIIIDNAKSTLDLLQQDEYRDIWNSINFSRPSEFKFVPELGKVDKLESLRQNERITSLSWAYSHKKDLFTFYANALLDKFKDNELHLQKISKLICFSLEDSLLTFNFTWDEENKLKIEEKIKGEDCWLIFNKIKLRGATLSIENKEYEENANVISSYKFINDDLLKYESILFSAFSFNFDKAYAELKVWNPKSYRKLNRAGFLALFDLQAAEKYLEEYSKNVECSSNKEQLYSLHLLNQIKYGISWNRNKELWNRIKKIENSGIKGFDENIDSIIDEYKKIDSTEIKPYGSDRFTVSLNGRSFSNDKPLPLKGLQYLQLFIEIGYPFCLNGIYIKDHNDWYKVFKSIFIYYPYPTLFYSLQYSDEKFIQRIAQDYAYSEELKEILSDLLSKLLKAFQQESTPSIYKKNILIFTSELFIATPSVTWENEFFIIWKDLLKNSKLFVDRHSKVYSFVVKALPFISGISIIRNIIFDILINSNNYSDQAIDYLYNFVKNEKFEQQKTNILNKKISEQLSTLINNIPDLIEESIFILGNLHQILTDNNKLAIKNELRNIDFLKIKSERVWHAILYFVHGDISIQKKIKQAILKNDRLWYSGITETGVSYGGYDFIELQNINKLNSPENGLIWSKNEVRLIFNSLHTEFEKIKKTKLRMKDIKFVSLLAEMYHFLKDEDSKLKDIEIYQSTFQEIETLYFEDREYSILLDGLSSEDRSTVILALSEFFHEIYTTKNITRKQEFIFLLNKIYFQKDPALEACLAYISNTFDSFKDIIEFRSYKPELIQILKRYKDFELIDSDKPFIQKRLITLAKVLRYWNEDNDIIIYWIDKGRKSNFNNIKQDIDE